MIRSQVDPLNPFHGLDTLISALTILKAHNTFHRPEEIKYVWQVTRRWTSATALFVFVRDSGPPERNPYKF